MSVRLGAPPWVAKPACGGAGEGIRLVEGAGQVRELDSSLPYLLQRRLREARSYRVLCSPSRALSVYQRRARGGMLVQSISAGGVRVPVTDRDLRFRLAELGRRMCLAVGGDVLGCDVLEDDRGVLWALETNVNFGFDADDSALADQLVTEVARGLPIWFPVASLRGAAGRRDLVE